VTETRPPDGPDALRDLFRSLEERSRAIEDDFLALNDQLRRKVDDLRRDIAAAKALLESSHEETLRDRERLRRKAEQLEAENRDFAQRYVELEDHSTSLTNLYAATFQLHSSPDPDAVVRTIVEIADNLIGAAEFVLYLADEAKGDFAVVAREGDLPPEGPRRATLDEPVEREAVKARRTVFLEELPEGVLQMPAKGLCCAPLYFRDRLVGAITIYALLEHKARHARCAASSSTSSGRRGAPPVTSPSSPSATSRR